MFKRLLAIIIFLITSLPQAGAILSKKHDSLDSRLMAVPQEINPDLNKTVNFSFKDTNISDILLLLSKVGNFNVILPNEYDQKISITLTNQKVIDAIDDISKLTKLNYEFKGNSLIFSDSDFKSMNFVSLPLAFYSAENMVSALNDTLFRQLEISAFPGVSKPHASIDPGRNSVIILGTDEQIEASKKFIEKLDVPDKVEIYTPSFINFLEIREIVKNNLSKEHTLKIKREDNNSILIKGTEKEVKAALTLIRNFDLPQDPVDLNLEFYALKPNSYEAFMTVNNSLKFGDVVKLNSNTYELGKAPNVFKFLEKKDLILLNLKKDELKEVMDLTVSQRREILNKETYVISFLNKGDFRIKENESLFYLLDREELKGKKELKKFSDSSQPDLVLVKLSVL